MIDSAQLEFKDGILDNPKYRQNILIHDKYISKLDKKFAALIRIFNEIFHYQEKLQLANLKLSEILHDFHDDEHSDEECLETSQKQISVFTADGAACKDDKNVLTAIRNYASCLKLLENDQPMTSVDAQKNYIREELINFREEIDNSKKKSRELKKATASYYQKLEKFLNTRTRIIRDSELEENFKCDRRAYLRNNLDYIQNTITIEEKCSFKLLDIMNLYFTMINVRLKGHRYNLDNLDINEYYLLQQRSKDSYEIIEKSLDDLKDNAIKLADKFAVMPENSNSSTNNAFSTKTMEVSDRQGYLYMLKKKSRITTSVWSKQYCRYNRNSRIFQITSFSPSNPQPLYDLNSEYFIVVKCTHKPWDVVERNFCFEIEFQQNETKYDNLLLQAACDEDRKNWLEIMDGEELIYKASVYPNSNEMPTLLNKKLFFFVQNCKDLIEQRSISQQGIYRTSPRQSDIQQYLPLIINEINHYSDALNEISLSSLKNLENTLICSLIKAVLTRLETPIIPFNLYDNFLSCAKLDDNKHKIAKISSLIDQLPNLNYAVLALIIWHLKRVADYSHLNQMIPQNIGVCFSPSLIRGSKEYMQSVAAIKDSKFGADLISEFISNVRLYFSTSQKWKVLSLGVDISDLGKVSVTRLDSGSVSGEDQSLTTATPEINQPQQTKTNPFQEHEQQTRQLKNSNLKPQFTSLKLQNNHNIEETLNMVQSPAWRTSRPVRRANINSKDTDTTCSKSADEDNDQVVKLRRRASRPISKKLQDRINMFNIEPQVDQVKSNKSRFAEANLEGNFLLKKSQTEKKILHHKNSMSMIEDKLISNKPPQIAPKPVLLRYKSSFLNTENLEGNIKPKILH